MDASYSRNWPPTTLDQYWAAYTLSFSCAMVARECLAKRYRNDSEGPYGAVTIHGLEWSPCRAMSELLPTSTCQTLEACHSPSAELMCALQIRVDVGTAELPETWIENLEPPTDPQSVNDRDKRAPL
jgi:hypothetical protein